MENTAMATAAKATNIIATEVIATDVIKKETLPRHMGTGGFPFLWKTGGRISLKNSTIW
jgi:hypothetical protein